MRQSDQADQIKPPLDPSIGIHRRDWLKQSFVFSSLAFGASSETISASLSNNPSLEQESPPAQEPKSKYLEFDGLGLAELVRTKQVTPLELLEDAMAQLKMVNPQINAIASTFFGEAKKRIMGNPFFENGSA